MIIRIGYSACEACGRQVTRHYRGDTPHERMRVIELQHTECEHDTVRLHLADTDRIPVLQRCPALLTSTGVNRSTMHLPKHFAKVTDEFVIRNKTSFDRSCHEPAIPCSRQVYYTAWVVLHELLRLLSSTIDASCSDAGFFQLQRVSRFAPQLTSVWFLTLQTDQDEHVADNNHRSFSNTEYLSWSLN